MKRKIKNHIYNRFFKEYQISSKTQTPPRPNYSDITEDEWDIIEEVSPFTLTNPERIVSLLKSIDYLESNGIEGDIVECGVWKGGSIMAILKRLKQKNNLKRNIFLYDTFQGMVQPTVNDESFKGDSAYKAFKTKDEFWDRIECASPLEEVLENIKKIEYPMEKIHFIKGKVEDTIPETVPDKIALLRLDTDWYESTLHEMNHLYPILVQEGIIMIDDYGHWKGCKEAVDQYIDENKLKLFLSRIDYTCRLGVKS